MKLPKRKKNTTLLELTPLIDIVFLLLSFYMLTSSFNAAEGLPMELPTADAPRVDTNKACTISIIDKDQVQFDDNKIPIFKLHDNIKSLDMNRHSFLIRSDKKSNVGTLVSVLEIIQDAGGKNVSIATTKR